jgi:hypothetical protein
MEINLPDVVEEVTHVFERYQKALQENDVAVLDAAFWDSPHTIRYAVYENGYGWNEIHDHRKARIGASTQERRLRTVVTTFGRNTATVNIEYKVRGQDKTGRQTQTWVRFPGTGWVVVSAHVSILATKG